MLKRALRHYPVILILVCAPFSAVSPLLSADPSASPATQPASRPAPLVFRGKTLFVVKERIRILTPAERAQIIEARIERITDDPSVTLESIGVSEGEDSTDVMAGDQLLMTVTDADAGAEARPRGEMAAEVSSIILEAVRSAREEASTRSLVLNLLYLVLATAALVLLLVGIARLKQWLLSRVRALIETRVGALRIQNLEILPAVRIDRVLAALVRGASVVAIVVLFYFYLSLALSFLPQTRNFAAGLLGYILDPLRTLGTGFVSYLPNLLFVLVAIVITRYILKAAHVFFTAIERQTLIFRGFHPEWARTTCSMVKMLIIVFAAVVVFPYLPGASSPAFQGISIFLGVLLSLGSSSAVANMVAGIILTYMRPFRVGDFVKIVDTSGIILEKNMLLTRIRTIKNVEITIPNSLVLGSHIVNYSASVGDPHLILHTSVTIGYDAPWRRVHELLTTAAAATEEILKEPKPFVLQRSLDDFYVTYELNAYTDRPQLMPEIYSKLHENIQDRFNEAGVEIMSPHYTQLRDGNKIAIPEDYLPAGYEPGSLRIRRVGGAEGKGPGGGS